MRDPRFDILFERVQISPTSRFAPENDHEPFMVGIKSVTSKPVVGVGRFTSPDTMASLIRRGVLDMVGAAPFGRDAGG